MGLNQVYSLAFRRPFLPKVGKFLIPRLATTRCTMSRSVNHASKVQLTCNPQSTLADKKVQIKIQGLEPKQEVTLRASLTGDVQDRYISFAHYIADDNGEVCLSSHPSVGGSYVGVEPMGFIWSLKPEVGQRPGRRLMKRDVTKPFVVNLDVLQSHTQMFNDKGFFSFSRQLLCSLKIERHFMGADVKRIEIREGRLRGTLFLPRGNGPFQGVMDLIGSHGGLVEFKAALLASNGFAAFTLAYLNFEDLPNDLKDLELEYFLEAVHWFKKHPQVIPGGVGVMGISKGAEIAVLLASHCESVAAVVCVSGLHGLSVAPISYKGVKMPYFEFLPSNAVVLIGNAVKCRNCYEDNWTGRIQDNPKATCVENIKGQLLVIYGTDDGSYDTEESASKMKKRMEAFGKGCQCSILGYHGAGHIIEPPYSPHVFMSYQKSLNMYFAWGGEDDKSHVDAQEHAWLKILEFFQKHLPQSIQSKL